MNKTIRGKIIRIVDRRTVIINLGRKDGIGHESIFNILSEPEPIIDPFTNELLGSVNIVKSKLKAGQVDDRFTIATTKWITSSLPSGILGLESLLKVTEVDEGELLVKPGDIQPWKARSEIPVQIGDTVEVRVTIPDTDEEENILPETTAEPDDKTTTGDSEATEAST